MIGRHKQLFLCLVALLIHGLVMRPLLLAQDEPPPDYFLTASVSNETPYLGESVTYTVRIYLGGVLRASPTYRPPEFTDLWQAQAIPSRVTRETYEGRSYDMTVIQNILYPVSTGSVSIQPSAIELQLDDRNIVIESNPVSLSVRPLPPDAPLGFTGAVGEYAVTTTVDNEAVQVGEALTLAMRVAGTGNLEQIPAPRLNLTTGWRVYPQTPDFQRSSYSTTISKTYSWLLIPTAPGTRTLNNLSWVYFDTAEQRYLRVSAEAPTIEVSGEALDVGAFPETNLLALKSAPQRLNTELAQVNEVFWLLWLLPVIVLMLVLVVRISENVQKQDDQRHRQKNAYRIAKRQLKAASKQGEKLFREIEPIIVRYFRNRSGNKKLTAQNLPIWLAEQDMPQDLAAELLNCVESAEGAQFAPAGMYRVGTVYSRTRSALRRLNKAWRPTSA